jgi:prepilin-type N-terminal cleavage/methylation domain-containing protein
MPKSAETRRRSYARAFTLIELLCVIGLVLILLGLLLPSIGRTRSRASEVHCQKNLKEIYESLLLYRGDFKDHLPRQARPYEEWSPHYGAAVARYMTTERPLTWERIAKIGSLHCPLNQHVEASSTYIINAFVFDSNASFLKSRIAHQWKKIHVDLEKLPLLWDSPAQGIGHCPSTLAFTKSLPDGLFLEEFQSADKPEHLNGTSSCNRTGLNTHGKSRCNVLFASGSVRSVDLAQTPLTDFDDGIR